MTGRGRLINRPRVSPSSFKSLHPENIMGRRLHQLRFSAAVFAACLLGASPGGAAQQSRTVADGVFTSVQAQRGEAIYKERCSPCHGGMLEGKLGPQLAGPDFVADFRMQPLAALVDKIKNTMPANDPGRLTREQSADLAAYILQANSLPAGRTDLSADASALQQIVWPAVVVEGKPATSATTQPAFPPIANLAQIMKGILFPNSNIVFNVQRRDPGQQKSYEVGKTDFSLVDWGAGVYPGWELVDNSALALAEAAPLLLTRGRRCENGKPVPVERPDWIKFTQELVEAGKAAYQASQSRSQDAVSEVTERLSDACFNCHIVYRDKLGGTPADPSNKAARCVP